MDSVSRQHKYKGTCANRSLRRRYRLDRSNDVCLWIHLLLSKRLLLAMRSWHWFVSPKVLVTVLDIGILTCVALPSTTPAKPTTTPATTLKTTTTTAAKPTSTATGAFSKAVGTAFNIDGVTSYFAGTNSYWIGFLTNNADVDLVMGHLQTSGIKILRVWGFNDVNTVPGSGTVWYQSFVSGQSPVINTGANGLERLDYVVQSAAAHDIKLIINFVNNWTVSHTRWMPRPRYL